MFTSQRMETVAEGLFSQRVASGAVGGFVLVVIFLYGKMAVKLALGWSPLSKFKTTVGGIFRLETRLKATVNGVNREDGKQGLLVNQNMQLRFFDQSNWDASYKRDMSGRKLVVFMSWLLAKEHHIEKYREIYFKRGFDVLTVHTYPIQFLLPPIGAQKVANNLTTFLKTNSSTYPNVVIHGCSVGAYLFAETMVKVNRALANPLHSEHQCTEIMARNIKGTVFDSIVDPEMTPYSFTRSVVRTPFLASIAEKVVSGYLRVTYPLALMHYKKATKAFLESSLKCPALFLVSESDVMTNMDINRKVVSSWKERGIDVKLKSWPHSKHMTLFRTYPEEYEQEINVFLKSINLNGNLD